jgi:murein DD-endopeptidase MepM/ murein hydrolase activator NlpD
MIGLALSMGASSLLIPRQNEGATAAEPTPTDATTTTAAASLSAPTAQVTEHVVSKGQTLWQIARQYQVDVNAIAATNSLKVGDVLKVGQVVQVPATRSEATRTEAPKPQLVASADLNQLPAEANTKVQPTEEVRVERNASLDRLRQQQEKLRNSLATLRTQEQEAKQEAKVEPSTIATKPPQPESVQPSEQVAVKPASNSDWLRSNQALTAPAAPELITTAPTTPVAPAPERRATVVPPVQPVAAKPAAELISYQVNPGDTAAQIARAHNISLSSLVQTNRISNPNIIFVGQVLRVPAPAPRGEQPRAAQPSPEPVEQVAVRPSVVPSTANLAPQSNLGTGGTLPDSRFDPHVQSLLAEIKVLRERHRSAEPEAAPVSTPEPQAVPASSLPSLTVGTQFNPGGLNTIQVENRDRSSSVPVRVPAAETTRTSASQPQQVAAAPAGSESYAPLLQPVTGRMVSPDLPPLQGEDNFLPEGSPVFKGYAWPAKGLMTSGYGWRWGRMHAGIDIAADIGTPIFAAADGVVEYSGWNSGGYGNLVEIRHADGSLTRYAHLNSSMVQEGQKVKQGEQIAEMGSTGYSTGPHLHFEVHVAGDGGTVDPIAYLPQQ